MSLLHDMLPHALESLEDVLRTNVEMAGHTFDEHLEHTLCRLAMAVQRRAEDRR